MRYRVHAAFDTEAREVVLAPSPPSARSALLVADDCVVELHATPTSSAAVTADPTLPVDAAACRLTLLPWASGRLRVCVNGISYGTGPLVLRDGDELTLRPTGWASGAAEASASTPSTYRIQAIPEPAPESRRQSAVENAGVDAEEERLRLETMLANLETYATWNNFYSDRFGNLATVPLVPSRCPNPTTASSSTAEQLHQCTCGGYVQSRATNGPSRSGDAHVERSGADAAEPPAGPTRTLLTLLPSLPELLEAGNRAASAPAPADVPCAPTAFAPWMCCHCSFIPASADPARRRCGTSAVVAAATTTPPPPPPTAGRASSTEASTQAPADAAPSTRKGRSKSKTADVPASSGEAAAPTAWSSYSRMRHHDWDDKAADDAAKVDASARGGAESGPCRLDAARSTVELFNRICSMESALMGCRYE